MHRYGQYCPIAMAVEIFGDRWTLLIVRDLLTGVAHFNELAHGLPGISRGLLAERLRRLEEVGVLEKTEHGKGRKTEYRLTQSGEELHEVINALLQWGARWAFDEPDEDQLDPLLLLWWMRSRVRQDRLPRERIVVRFDFYHKKRETYWLLMTTKDVSVCLTSPGFDTDVIVAAELAAFYQVWMGRLSYREALDAGKVRIDAIPPLARGFPEWFSWSLAAPAVRAARIARGEEALEPASHDVRRRADTK